MFFGKIPVNLGTDSGVRGTIADNLADNSHGNIGGPKSLSLKGSVVVVSPGIVPWKCPHRKGGPGSRRHRIFSVSPNHNPNPTTDMQHPNDNLNAHDTARLALARRVHALASEIMHHDGNFYVSTDHDMHTTLEIMNEGIRSFAFEPVVETFANMGVAVEILHFEGY